MSLLAGTIHFHNKATKVTKHRNRGSFDFFSGQAGHPVVTESAQWVGVVQPSQIFVSFVNFCSQLHTYGLEKVTKARKRRTAERKPHFAELPHSEWPSPSFRSLPVRSNSRVQSYGVKPMLFFGALTL